MKKGIGVMGTVVLDQIKYVSEFPKKSDLTTINKIEFNGGGAICNCISSLCRVDSELPIEAITVLGDDESGDFLYDSLKSHKNVSVEQISRREGRTPFTDAMTDQNDKTRTFFTYKGNRHLIDVDTVDFDKLNVDILHVAYILILEGLDREDEEYGTRMARLLKKAQDNGIKTSIDVVSVKTDEYKEKMPPALKYTNYCIINETEAGRTVGIQLRDEEDNLIVDEIGNVLRALMDMGVKDWAVIHCPEGAFGYDGKNMYNVPSIKLSTDEIIGTVGAGDAFAAGTLYGAYRELDIVEAMKVGTASSASLLIGKDMCYEELLEMYNNREKNSSILI